MSLEAPDPEKTEQFIQGRGCRKTIQLHKLSLHRTIDY